jgi:hypothetical protein
LSAFWRPQTGRAPRPAHSQFRAIGGRRIIAEGLHDTRPAGPSSEAPPETVNEALLVTSLTFCSFGLVLPTGSVFDFS